MEKMSSSTSTWEEEMYWKNFHFARFSLILPSDFLHHVKLPKKFTDYMKTTLPDKVVLKVNGVAWNVNLVKGNEHVMFKGHGWQEFAKAYSLKEADMLVLNYNRRECFDIMLFDQANSCEMEASYFVRKSEKQQPECGSGYNGQSNEGEDISTECTRGIQVGSGEAGYYTPRNKQRKAGTIEGNSYVKVANIRDDGSGDESDQSSDTAERQHSTPRRKAPLPGVSTVPSNCLSLTKRKYRTAGRTAPRRGVAYYKSNRRPVNEEEIQKTLEMAMQKSEEHKNSFVVVMRPSSVYKRFFLSIPKGWRPKSVLRKGQSLILQVNDKSWPCTFNGGLEAGWKKFTRDNCLEEHDVCLFSPTDPKDGKYVLNVSIFRVVQEVTLPSLVTP